MSLRSLHCNYIKTYDNVLLNLVALKDLATLFNYSSKYHLLPYLGLLDDLYSKQLILQRINDDHDMSKVSVDDTMSVIPIVFGPHNVNLVITNMTNLQQDRMHPCLSLFFWHVQALPVCAS